MTSKPEHDEVAAAYDRWAAVYDSNTNPTRDLDAVVLRRQPLRLEGADVLELGCGTGKNTEWLASAARSVLALDFSEGMLERARARIRADNVRFLRADLREKWPVGDASADVAVVDLVLEHLERLEPFFREAARALRPGGRLFVCELHPLKQQQGSQARFEAPQTGQVERVRAFRHEVSEFLEGASSAGLRLVQAEDWRAESDAPEAPPRLFSALWLR